MSTSKKSGGIKGKTSRPKSAPPPLKVVMRRLPHGMLEDSFLEVAVELANEAGLGEIGGLWDLVYFNAGKMSKKRGKVQSLLGITTMVLRLYKPERPSGPSYFLAKTAPLRQVPGTAYLRFKRGRSVDVDANLARFVAAVEASEAFSSRKDKAGEEDLRPIVEVAPFQKLYRQKPKRDVRVGTIRKDADFKAFCEALAAPVEKLPGADVQADLREAEGKEVPEPTNTLLEYLKERRFKRTREAQRTLPVGGGLRRERRVSSSGNSVSGGPARRSSGDGETPRPPVILSNKNLTGKPKRSGERDKVRGPEAPLWLRKEETTTVAPPPVPSAGEAAAVASGVDLSSSDVKVLSSRRDSSKGQGKSVKEVTTSSSTGDFAASRVPGEGQRGESKVGKDTRGSKSGKGRSAVVGDRTNDKVSAMTGSPRWQQSDDGPSAEARPVITAATGRGGRGGRGDGRSSYGRGSTGGRGRSGRSGQGKPRAGGS